jgi:hypothetical protein
MFDVLEFLAARMDDKSLGTVATVSTARVLATAHMKQRPEPDPERGSGRAYGYRILTELLKQSPAINLKLVLQFARAIVAESQVEGDGLASLELP